MKRTLFILINLFLLIPGLLHAHPWKPDHYVIIDTDGGLDDFRAITLMMESPNIRILAITTSNGVLSADEAYNKVKSLVISHHHEGILVGVNENDEMNFKNCKPALEFNWGIENSLTETKMPTYNNVLNQVFQYSNEKITFINLGGLNTFKEYFSENENYLQRLKEVVWTVNTEKIKSSFNYSLDTMAYVFVKNSNISLTMLNGSSFGNYPEDLIKNIKGLHENLHHSLTFNDSPFTKVLYDEAVVFYLISNQIFSLEKSDQNFMYSFKQDMNYSDFYIELLESVDRVQNQVFKEISTDTADYTEDIQLIMDSTIDKYGKEEWNACVLTSELHRHLGVYALIGAKMGVRAKEYFGAGADELKIVSYAGLTPPFSCLNDGLQVSTGATIGHGLITVNENTKLPKAEFEYLGQKITVSLKGEYRAKIASEIKELSTIYGLDSNIYWDLVRDLAVKYWSNWDRHEIFDVEVK
ncbi:MAG: nucleoside hydrolase [Bacteroidetes bacterium]|nr:nucleoside hydrolase [Bacteroidota bacterium]